MIITTNKRLHFVEEYGGGRELQLGIGARQRVPGWIRWTGTFRAAVRDGSIIVHEDSRPAIPATRQVSLPKFENRETASFWRSRRSELQVLLDRQRHVGINETHSRWLKGFCFYEPGSEDLKRCQVGTGIDGQIISDFQDVATQVASGLGCPPGIDPVAFCLYCLARNLSESDRPELRSEILGEKDVGGIVPDLLGSLVSYCSRLAAESGRRAIAKESQQEPMPDDGRSAMTREQVGGAEQQNESAQSRAGTDRSSVEKEEGAGEISIRNANLILLSKVLKRKDVGVEVWVHDHGLKRSVFYEWQRLVEKGLSLKGRISRRKAAEIEAAIAQDARELGLAPE
jgi:hypothetical protein